MLLKSILHNLKKTFFFKNGHLKGMWYQNNDVAMSWTNLKGEKNSPLLLCMAACLHHWKKKRSFVIHKFNLLTQTSKKIM